MTKINLALPGDKLVDFHKPVAVLMLGEGSFEKRICFKPTDYRDGRAVYSYGLGIFGQGRFLQDKSLKFTRGAPPVA